MGYQKILVKTQVATYRRSCQFNASHLLQFPPRPTLKSCSSSEILHMAALNRHESTIGRNLGLNRPGKLGGNKKGRLLKAGLFR